MLKQIRRIETTTPYRLSINECYGWEFVSPDADPIGDYGDDTPGPVIT